MGLNSPFGVMGPVRRSDPLLAGILEVPLTNGAVIAFGSNRATGTAYELMAYRFPSPCLARSLPRYVRSNPDIRAAADWLPCVRASSARK